MNRFTQKVLSGGIVAGLSLAFAASASAQAARSGAWTLNGKEGDWTMTFACEIGEWSSICE